MIFDYTPLNRFATERLVDLGKTALGSFVRSQPFQTVRNAVLDASSLGTPEQTYIKAMTGGDPQGVQLSNDQLARLKEAHNVQKDPSRRPIVREFDPNHWQWEGMTPAQLEIERDFHNKNHRKWDNNRLAKFNSPYITTYGHRDNDSGYGRDLKLTFGGLSMTPQDDGGMRIYDEWDIDSAAEVAKDATTGLGKDAKDSFTKIHDLFEGGSAPSIVANIARNIGTYEPIVTDITVPGSEWNAIDPREATIEERLEPNQGPLLNKLNSFIDSIPTKLPQF